VKVVERSFVGKVNIKFRRRVKKDKGLICNLRNQEGLKITRKKTKYTREKGRGAIDLSTGSYISLVLLGRGCRGRLFVSEGG
jgi:hypothetical protein